MALPAISENSGVVSHVSFYDSHEVPMEIALALFSWLNEQSLITARLVCRSWCVAASDQSLWNAVFQAKCFGPKQWSALIGSVEERVTAVPSKMMRVMKAQDPFTPDKRIEQTHVAIWMPCQLNEKPFTLDLLRESGFLSCYPANIQKQIGATTAPTPYWALVTQFLIPGTPGKSYTDQAALAKQHGYEPPFALEASTFTLTGSTLFQDKDTLFTHCEEIVNNQYVVVGKMFNQKFEIRTHRFPAPYCGMIGMMRFPPSEEKLF